MILHGGNEKFSIASKTLGITRDYKIGFEGILNFITNQFSESNSASIKRWAKDFMDKNKCPSVKVLCLKKEALYYRINEKNIAELALVILLI